MARTIFFSLTACLIGTQSVALSCLRPDLARSFQAVADLPYDVAVFVGQVRADGTPFDRREASTFHKGRFTGYQIAPNGQSADIAIAITVEKSCAGPWCGDVPQDAETIFFMSPAAGIGADGWLAHFGPCGGDAFPADAANMETLQSCLRGDACEPDNN